MSRSSQPTSSNVLFSLLLLAITNVCSAQSTDFAGTWVVKVGHRNLFVLRLKSEGNSFSGQMERPASFSSSNSTFANISGLRRDPIVHSHLDHGILHLTTANSNNPKDTDQYAMTLKADGAQLAFDDLPPGVVAQPLSLERGSADAMVSTDWEPNRLYVPGPDSDTPNPEMKAIFDEDQRVRMQSQIDWNAVSKTDAQRRNRTRELLNSGALHTGTDYEEAAFVFQHGSSSDDYLLAHTLAMVAMTKGNPTAIGIATMTLDRYLQNVGQKQIFGTQFLTIKVGGWTQDPYDRVLISDALRKQLAVLPQAIQAEQLKAYQSQK